MKRRKSKHRAPGEPPLPGLTPPPPDSVRGEATQPETPGEDFNVFAGVGNAKPIYGSPEWWKAFDRYYTSALWKQRATRRLDLANHQCGENGCPHRAAEVHHLNYDRWGKGGELDGDLLPLCKTHHALADAKRRAESRAAFERDSMDALDAARFEGFVRAVCGDSAVDPDTLSELRERYDEKFNARDGDDSE